VVGGDGGLDGVLFEFAGDECLAAGASLPWSAYPDLRGVHAQGDAFGSGNPAGPDITLGAAGPWRLRASCRGRGKATARVGVDLFYEGVEEWLLQLRPAAEWA